MITRLICQKKKQPKKNYFSALSKYFLVHNFYYWTNLVKLAKSLTNWESKQEIDQNLSNNVETKLKYSIINLLEIVGSTPRPFRNFLMKNNIIQCRAYTYLWQISANRNVWLVCLWGLTQSCSCVPMFVWLSVNDDKSQGFGTWWLFVALNRVSACEVQVDCLFLLFINGGICSS